MTKKKTLKKQKNSFKNMPIYRLKKITGLSPFKAAQRIRDKRYISKALWQCILADDPEGFKEILKVHLELKNKEKIIKETSVSRRTLFRMLSKKGNPTLENISKIVHKLCA